MKELAVGQQASLSRTFTAAALVCEGEALVLVRRNEGPPPDPENVVASDDQG